MEVHSQHPEGDPIENNAAADPSAFPAAQLPAASHVLPVLESPERSGALSEIREHLKRELGDAAVDRCPGCSLVVPNAGVKFELTEAVQNGHPHEADIPAGLYESSGISYKHDHPSQSIPGAAHVGNSSHFIALWKLDPSGQKTGEVLFVCAGYDGWTEGVASSIDWRGVRKFEPMSPAKDLHRETVTAPWTAEQVATLNEYQRCFSPYRRSSGLLIATPDGWVEQGGGPVVATQAPAAYADRVFLNNLVDSYDGRFGVPRRTA